MAVQKQDDQHEHTFSNSVRIRDVLQKTCLRRWTKGKSGERGSGISVLPARHDDDDDCNFMLNSKVPFIVFGPVWFLRCAWILHKNVYTIITLIQKPVDSTCHSWSWLPDVILHVYLTPVYHPTRLHPYT